MAGGDALIQLLLHYPLLPLLSLLTAVLGAIGLRNRCIGWLHAAACSLCILLVTGLALELPGEVQLLLLAVPLVVSLLFWKGETP